MSEINNEPKRIVESYNPQTLTAINEETLEEVTLYLFQMRLFVWENSAKLSSEIYKEEQFESGIAFINPNNREFEMDYSQVKADYSTFFSAIENAFFAWLGVSGNDYKIKMLDINLHTLKIRAEAVHKTRPSKNIEDETKTLEEFEQIKADYPELVQAYFDFARTYSAANDSKLARFN
jgi:hypothetical protein